MTTQEPISPELQARIDALPEGGLKNRVVRALTGPGIRSASNEEIFENIIQSAAESHAQRAKWRQWRDEEVLDFVDYFKAQSPHDYAEFFRQEHENNEIDDEIWWRTERLAERFFSELSGVDRSSLLGKVRDHLRTMTK
jgi:hypothetical protein